MHRLIISLCALAAFGLGSAWALLNRDLPASAPVPTVLATVAASCGPDARDYTPPLQPMPVDGYCGTAIIRATAAQDEAENSPPRPAPKAAPLPGNLPDWRAPATEAQFGAVAAALAASPRYRDALLRLYQLGQGAQWVSEPDPARPGQQRRVLETAFQRQPEAMAPFLFAAFEKARGVARQNIIFQIALALPADLHQPWLRALAAGADAADADDATCALAFTGDAAAGAAFEASPATDCNLLCDSAGQHDELALQERRDVLRSYRCMELLDCRPYFWRHCWDCGRGAECPFPWAARRQLDTADQRQELAGRLLPAWLKRFAGHPGSDDMAWRLCQDCKSRQQWFEAAQWASRCATMPDQDMCAAGLADLVTLAERELAPSCLLDLLQGDDWQRNRELVQYIRLRRCAAETGFADALALAACIAQSDPASLLGRCFAARWRTEVPRGLESGVVPLPAGDPLRRVEPGPVPDQPGFNPQTRFVNWYLMTNRGAVDDALRLAPPKEALRLAGATLARQFRLWETMAELQRRRDASAGDERADLAYKIGAVYYHQSFVVYPVYANERHRNGMPRDISPLGRLVSHADELVRLNFASRARAALEFEYVADHYPGWEGHDKALYSAALSRIKLVDYRPFDGFADNDITAAVGLFDRLAREHPDSDLARSGRDAASYWRRMRPNLFRPLVSNDD